MKVDIHESTVAYGMLFTLWVYYIWIRYLHTRQYYVCKNTQKIPEDLKEIFDDQCFEICRLYALDLYKYQFLEDTVEIISSSLIIYYRILSKLWYFVDYHTIWKNEIAISTIWLFIVMLFSKVIHIILGIYWLVNYEGKYNRNKPSIQSFINDGTKDFFVSQLIYLPLAAIAIVIIKNGGPWFHVWLALCIGAIYTFLVVVYPEHIAPYFCNLQVLEDCELKSKIKELVHTINIPLENMYVVNGTALRIDVARRGFFTSKSITICNVTINKSQPVEFTIDEILALLAHEFAHWNNNHLLLSVLLEQIDLLIACDIVSMWFHYPHLYESIGFKNIKPVLVGLIVILEYAMVPYSSLATYSRNVIMRRWQFQADRYVIDIGKDKYFLKALIKIHRNSLTFPINDYMYSAWYNSNPTLLERISEIRQIKQASVFS